MQTWSRWDPPLWEGTGRTPSALGAEKLTFPEIWATPSVLWSSQQEPPSQTSTFLTIQFADREGMGSSLRRLTAPTQQGLCCPWERLLHRERITYQITEFYRQWYLTVGGRMKAKTKPKLSAELGKRIPV